MSTAPQIMAFEAAAERALRRVVARRALAMAGRTLPWALGLVGLALLMQFLGGVGTWLAVVMVLGWLVFSAVWAWVHKPGKYEALALWDQVRKASEAFASAWWFGLQAERTPMQQRHVEAQTLALDLALPNLAKDLPLPRNRWLWLVPALALAGVVGGAWQHRIVPEERLTEAMKQTAETEAKSLAATDWQKKKLEGLTETEKKEVEKLHEDLKATAKELQSRDDKSAREVLNSLEKRAHETEKLAKKLGNDGEAWASEKLVAELRKHADTADLGDAVASKNAAQAAKHAGDLAAQLKVPQPVAEFLQRLNESLKDVRKQAETADRKRVVGSHVIGAGEALEAALTPDAAKEFEQLAAALRAMAQREQSRKELEKLAEQLRDAGNRIAGNQGGGLQKMAGANSQQSQAKGGQQAQAAPQQQQAMNQQPLQAPGLAQAAPQQLLQEGPQPGAGQQQQMQISQAQPGQTPPPGSRPMLIAPVPGQKNDKPPESLIITKDPPKATDGNTITLNTPGGPQAGNATAKLDAQATAPKKTNRDSQVNAARNNDGQSSSRSVEGGVSQDKAARTAQQTAVDFIKQQEEALDDAALPPARREQVRRYFNELRKRFEEGK